MPGTIPCAADAVMERPGLCSGGAHVVVRRDRSKQINNWLFNLSVFSVIKVIHSLASWQVVITPLVQTLKQRPLAQ